MKIRFEQTLHGYNMGHGLLASSVPWMEREDASLMATLSDWTGYRGSIEEDDNYLTVYPLPNGRFMAFAKTWYAREMERPGCVWTHTILIPKECLKGNVDIRLLLTLFERPKKDNYASYSEPLEIEIDEVSNYIEEPIFRKIDRTAFLFLFSVLINGLKGACLGIDRSQKEIQTLLLSLLQYLPLDMLLKASVSSGSEAVRRINNVNFSIQFLMGFKAETLERGSWKDSLFKESFTQGQRYIYDVACLEKDKTSYLIHLFNDDIGSSPLKFEAVVNLFRLLDDAMAIDKDTPSYNNDVLPYVLGAFPKGGEGQLVKANFFGKKISDYFCSDSECLHSVALRNVEEEDWKYVQLDQRLPHLKHSELQSLAYILAAHNTLTTTPQKILLYAFEHMNALEINAIVESCWNQLKLLVIGNESYIKNEHWMMLEKTHFNEFFQALPIECDKYIRQWERLLSCVLKNETKIDTSWVKDIFEHVSSAVRIVLDYSEHNMESIIDDRLLNECYLHIHNCLDWMNEQTNGINNVFLLNSLTSHLDPFSKAVCDYSKPYWINLLNSCSKDPSFLSFVFVIAFQQTGHNCLTLMRKSFDDIYILQSKSRFPAKDWKRIAFCVGEIKLLKDWDKCKRLCLAVIKYLHQEGYDKNVVVNISNNRFIRERLAKCWKRMYE